MIRKILPVITRLVLIALLWIPPSYATDATSGLVLGGSLDAPIRFEVFSDFECPGCRYFYREVMVPVLQDYASRDKVCVIYHEYPLNMHAHAHEAARYCEAAYRMGREKALQVIDTLFEHQAEWTRDGNIEKVLSMSFSTGEMQELKVQLRDSGVEQSIRQGMQLGQKLQVRGTPTLFVHYLGRMEKVENLQFMHYSILKDFIDRIVK